jgi:hypothetical protein
MYHIITIQGFFRYAKEDLMSEDGFDAVTDYVRVGVSDVLFVL